MMRAALYCIPLLLFAITTATAQEAYLFGKVKDAKTFEPLIGVTVVVDDTTGATTDIDGKYKLKVTPGNHHVTFSFIGYETEKKNVEMKDGAFKEINISLDEKSEQLQIVVVSASQFEKNIAEETVSMEVIDADLIANTNSRDLGEVISKTSGVQVQDQQITIRGGSSYSYGVGSRTAVLVDGQSYLSADLGDAQLKFAPLENAEQIEVIKGASSVVYGSSALNGVVNVRTAWPKSGEKSTEVNTYFGVYDNPKREELKWYDPVKGYTGLFVNHRQRIKNLQLLAGGNLDYLSNYLEKGDEFRVRGNFKTKYTLPNNPKINFGVDGNIMKEVSQRFFISADMDSNAYRYGVGSLDHYIRTAVSPHFAYRDDNGNRFAFNMLYFNIFRDGNPNDEPDGGLPNVSSNNMSFDIQYQKNWNKQFVLTVGTPVTVGFSRSNLYAGRQKTFAGAGYAQLEYKIQRLSLVGGVRYEFSSVDTVFETSIPVVRTGLNYRAGKASHLRFSWGQAYRLPSVGERFIAAPFTGTIYIIPNPELLVEKGWSMELGLKQGLAIKKWQGYFDVSLFWMEFEEQVEYRFGLWQNKWPNGEKIFPDLGGLVVGAKPFNVENARIFGFEVSIVGDGKIGPVNITTQAGYTYFYPGNLESDSTQKNIGTFLKNAFKYFATYLEGEDAEKVLQFRQRHLLRGDIELEYKKFSVGYSLYYNSFFERIPDEFRLVVGFVDSSFYGNKPATLDKYIERHVNGDVWMDMRFAYQVKENVRISFLIKNLTNYEFANRPGKMDPPRNYAVQIRYRF